MSARPARRRVPRTEERVFPAARRIDDPLLAEHRARYRFAAASVRGRVCDLGCGTGYGAQEIARQPGIVEVVAVDRSAEALETASAHYPHPKARWVERDLLRPGWETDLGRFDAVVAFEVLEHLADEGPLWRGLRTLLTPGGILWLSTPLGRGRGIPASDPFHAHQLRRGEVEALFRDGWRARFFGQAGTWIETWTPGRRYSTMLARAVKEDR